MSTGEITIIGGGLAGSEAAWQAAERGAHVTLHEMRPVVPTAVHKTGLLAELVCSNSLKSRSLQRAGGLLKEELRRLGSLIMRCADESEVPGGQALAVDRDLFAGKVTAAIEQHPNISLVREEVTELPADRITIVATGPLTSERLVRSIFALTGEDCLFFYDALSPIVAADSIDPEHSFKADRWDKGDDEPAYINCPLTEEQYDAFYAALLEGESAVKHDFEPDELFEGCLPVEVIAARGRQALLFGPMRPVGLTDPRTGRRPFAVLQLRPENAELTMYNLVGFQTSLKPSSQERIFRLIPALHDAEFCRYGMMHRNTYIHSPGFLNAGFQCLRRPDLFFAGQLTGVEGYNESTASGLVCGINAVRVLRGRDPLIFPRETVIGSLGHHVSTPPLGGKRFEPMNANFGMMPPLDRPRGMNKRDHKQRLAERALAALETVQSILG